MATTQVKFYSMASLPSENVDQNGLYFIQGGELYKGSQRFGLGRVTTASTSEELNALTGLARGDINVGVSGALVYDGSTWQQLGGDIEELTSLWRSDISTWTSGLVAGGNGSIINQITQGNDGKVTASAVAFPTFATGDADGELKLGSVSAKVSGWDALVSSVAANASGITANASSIAANASSIAANASDIASLSSALGAVSSRVTGIEGIVDVSTSAIAASSGSFANLTINGSTVAQIADAEIAAIASSTLTSASNGITISVGTQGGSISVVSIDASTFGNVMHFRDVVSNTSDVSDPVAGDIVVIGSNADTGFVTGQEYIYTQAGTWEVIGDQSTYAVNAYSSSASVYTGATTLPGAVDAAGAAIDVLNSNVATLSSTVAGYVGGTSSSTSAGVEVSVSINASTMAPTLGVSIDTSSLQTSLGLGTAAYAAMSTSVDPSASNLPTASAVADYVSNALTWITSV